MHLDKLSMQNKEKETMLKEDISKTNIKRCYPNRDEPYLKELPKPLDTKSLSEILEKLELSGTEPSD